MGLFNWSAPLFHRFSDRWSDERIDQIASAVRPFLAGRHPSGRILDLGGGTGALARRLNSALDVDVTVLDPTPQMLRDLPSEGPVTGVLGVAEAMPFEDDSFDAAIVMDAIHHFRDQPGAVAELRRVVRPAGGVLVYDYDPRHRAMRVIAFFENALGEPCAFFTPQELCAFMAERRVPGECESEGGASYRFVGTVEP